MAHASESGLSRLLTIFSPETAASASRSGTSTFYEEGRRRRPYPKGKRCSSARRRLLRKRSVNLRRENSAWRSTLGRVCWKRYARGRLRSTVPFSGVGKSDGHQPPHVPKKRVKSRQIDARQRSVSSRKPEVAGGCRSCARVHAVRRGRREAVSVRPPVGAGSQPPRPSTFINPFVGA